MYSIKGEEIDVSPFYLRLIKPKPLNRNLLMVNQNQVAGHAGFYSLQGSQSVCLKPFNTRCVRGRREHLFYQLMEYFKSRVSSDRDDSLTGEKIGSNPHELLYYKSFPLLNLPDIKCNCELDCNLFKSLAAYIPSFHHVRHMVDVNDLSETLVNQEDFLKSVYSENLMCPCYGRNPTEKSSCSKDYEKTDFLCLQDLTSHCRNPCIADIKIGLITYDPMAIKEKVLEQSSKYRQLREFGFRILGMKVGSQMTDKSFGKTLETPEQVLGALSSFLEPLANSELKRAIIERILLRLRGLMQVFSELNHDQLKFFSSSLLIVYDKSAGDSAGKDEKTLCEELADSVRVYMIDFAHVFHVHQDCNTQTCETSGEMPDNMDSNYMFGLGKLISFFFTVNQSLQPPNPAHLPPPPPEWHHP